MDTKQIDDMLLSVLKSFPYFSRLWVCLSIKIADHAAQMHGYRSTRYIDDSKSRDVDETFFQLLNTLCFHVNECICYLEEEHSYKEEISTLNLDLLECLLEDVLFEMTTYDCSSIFKDMMFD